MAAEYRATAFLRKPTMAFWNRVACHFAGFSIKFSAPSDVKEVRPIGSLDDFHIGLAQVILDLVMANELGRTSRGLYMYDTSFIRLSMLGADWPAEHSPAHKVHVVIEDKTITSGWTEEQVESLFVGDYRDRIPWRLYDPIGRKIDPAGVATLEAYHKAVMFDFFGHDLPEDESAPKSGSFRPSRVDIAPDGIDKATPVNAAPSTCAARITLRDRLDILHKLGVTILRVPPSLMDAVIDYEDHKKDKGGK